MCSYKASVVMIIHITQQSTLLFMVSHELCTSMSFVGLFECLREDVNERLPPKVKYLEDFYHSICRYDGPAFSLKKTRDLLRCKLVSIQFPAMRYFGYFIVCCLMAKDNSNNTTTPDICFFTLLSIMIEHISLVP